MQVPIIRQLFSTKSWWKSDLHPWLEGTHVNAEVANILPAKPFLNNDHPVGPFAFHIHEGTKWRNFNNKFGNAKGHYSLAINRMLFTQEICRGYFEWWLRLYDVYTTDLNQTRLSKSCYYSYASRRLPNTTESKCCRQNCLWYYYKK